MNTIGFCRVFLLLFFFFVTFFLWLNCVNLSNVLTIWTASQFTCQQFKGDCFFLAKLITNLNYLQTVIFYAKYLWSSFLQSRSTEMKKKKKTSVIFNYRFCVNHYWVSFSAPRSITRRRGREVPGSIAPLPSRDSRPLIIKFHCTNIATASSAKEIVNTITGPLQIREKSA